MKLRYIASIFLALGATMAAAATDKCGVMNIKSQAWIFTPVILNFEKNMRSPDGKSKYNFSEFSTKEVRFEISRQDDFLTVNVFKKTKKGNQSIGIFTSKGRQNISIILPEWNQQLACNSFD